MHENTTRKRASLVLLAPLVAAGMVGLMLLLTACSLATTTELLAVTLESVPRVVVVDEIGLKEQGPELGAAELVELRFSPSGESPSGESRSFSFLRPVPEEPSFSPEESFGEDELTIWPLSPP